MSQTKVTCKICHKIYTRSRGGLKTWSGRCIKCWKEILLQNVGNKHPRWKKQNYCIDCRKEVAKKGKIISKRCQNCYIEFSKKRTGEKHPLWKNKKNRCAKCGKVLFNWKTKHCRKCYIKYSEPGMTPAEYRKKWRKMNLKKAQWLGRIAAHKRRLKEKLIPPLKLEIIQLVYENNIKKYGTLTCIYCLKFIKFGNDTLDHKIPISRDGTNEYNNLVIACRNCNSSKNNKTEKEFKKWKGVLNV